MSSLFLHKWPKITFFLIFMLVGFSTAYSQDAESEREITEAIENAKSGKYEEAIPVLKKYADSKYDDDLEILQINVYLNWSYLNTGNELKNLDSLNFSTDFYLENHGISTNDSLKRFHETSLFYFMGHINGTVGNYEKMINNFLIVKEYYEHYENEPYGYFVEILHLLAWGYQNLGDYNLAINLGLESFDNNKKLFGEINEFALKNLNVIYDSYLKQNNPQNSLPYLIKWLEIGKEFLGIENDIYLAQLLILGDVYRQLGDYPKFLENTLKVSELGDKVWGENTLEYITCQSNLAFAYSITGDYDKALEINLKVVELGKEILGGKHPDYLTSLGNLGNIYSYLGEYQSAKKILEQVVETSKEVLGENHPNYLSVLGNLAFSYSGLGDYNRALEIYSKVVELGKEILGEKNPDYLTSLENLGNTYSYLGEYQSAKKILEQVVETGKEVLGENHPNYLRSLGNLASSYSGLGEYQSALEIYLNVVEIGEKVFGENHLEYFTALDNLANTYSYLGDYKSAEEILTKVVKSTNEILGEKHPYYLRSLGNLALCYSNLGDYKLALELSLEVVDLGKQILGEKNPDYLTSLENLAGIYSSLGDYQSALEIIQRVIELGKESLSEKHPNYLRSLGNLANIYNKIGDYKSALEIYLKVLGLAEGVLTEKNLDYLTLLENLGNTYSYLGDYKLALENSQKAVELGKIILGEKHSNYLRSLSNLASRYSDLGDYQSALKINQQVVELGKLVWGENHPYYFANLLNLALSLSDMGYYQEALDINKKVVEFRKDFFGEKHPDFLTSLGNLASTLSAIGDYQMALETVLKVVELEKNVLGEKHPDYLISLGNLAYYYSNLEDYESALEINLKVVEAEKESVGEEHPSYLISLNNLARNYFYLNKNDLALKHTFQSLNLTQERVLEYFGQLTEFQREKFWIKNYFSFKTFPLFLERASNSNPEEKNFAFDIALFTKGLLLNTTLDFDQLLVEKGTPEAIEKYKDLKLLKLQIQRLNEKPIAERYLNVDSLGTVAQKIETELVNLSKEYGDYTQNLKITWKDVQTNLGDRDVAIEFLEYPTLTDTVKYAALVLRKGWENPKFVPLFRKDQIDEFIKRDPNQIYSNGFVGKEIKKLIWNPLEEFIAPGENVYFSAAGILHQLAIENISYDGSTTLGDRYQMYRLSSTKELALQKPESKTQSVALYGGIKYDLELDEMIAGSKKYERKDTFLGLRGIDQDTIARKGWQFLPGTLAEANEVSQILNKNRYQISEYIGETGSEESFKDLSGKKTGIIHIATHGFFLPVEQSKRNPFIQMRFDGQNDNAGYVDPMLRSGLLLAGGNRAWQGDSIPNTIEDGVLTAKEISHIDLRGTDLVVLSACETGLGDVSSEGVFGLQRAFKQAGAQTIIMSLWNVKDEATQYLMTSFYTYFAEGASKREAFIQARNKCREKYPDPASWAAFIMLD